MGVKNEFLGLFLSLVMGFLFGLTICAIDERYGVVEDWPTYEMISRYVYSSTSEHKPPLQSSTSACYQLWLKSVVSAYLNLKLLNPWCAGDKRDTYVMSLRERERCVFYCVL